MKLWEHALPRARGQPGKVPRKDFPDAKIHYSPDLWQAPWESNLAFQMNGRSGKRGACPSGEVIKITAVEGSSNPGFQLKTLLAIPHRQHSVKKIPQKNTFLSMNLQACTEKLMIIKWECKPRFYQPSQLLHMEQKTLQSYEKTVLSMETVFTYSVYRT